MKHIFIFFFILLNLSATAQYLYIPVLKGQDGDALLSGMVADYKPVTVLSYSDAREEMYTSIDNVNGNVTGIYTEHSILLPSNESDPIQFLLMNNAVNGINCEHTYPQSKGAANGNARSDMHHLYPARAAVNSSRGSKPYGENNDNDTDTWYYLNQSQSSIPNASVIDNYSESDNLAFEPRESVKGNIARGMMYFYTMYKAEADAADPNFFWDQIETLCEWHYSDPVDQEEWNRTMEIGEMQGDNPNPYVLDCSVAARTYCPQISAACETLVPTIDISLIPSFNLYPNPSSNQINIDLDTPSDHTIVSMIDVYGKTVYSSVFKDQKSIIVDHNFPIGTYICQLVISNEVFNVPFIVVK